MKHHKLVSIDAPPHGEVYLCLELGLWWEDVRNSYMQQLKLVMVWLTHVGSHDC